MSGKSFGQAVPPTIPASNNLDTLNVRLLKASVIIGGDPNLPKPLVSIANLTTTRNDMLYTVASDTYATSQITSAGRSFLTGITASDQQSSINLVPGTDVQAYSNTLDSVNTIGEGVSNQLLYTTGVGYSNTPVTAYVRSDILTATSADDLAVTTGLLLGPVSTTNRVVKVSDTNKLTETGLVIDASDNLIGVNDVAVGGELTAVGDIGGISSSERTQLANINTTTISPTQWGYVGVMDQSLNTSNTPTFEGMDMSSSKITSLLDPTNSQDAATKIYVDIVANTGSAPLQLVHVSTNVVLPNSPVYASPAETLTSTGAPGSLTIDGLVMVVTDRVLVKDQTPDTENGVYVVTDDGATPGPNWILTRSTDFNQASMPHPAGTSVFTEINAATVNAGSTWSLESTITNVDPLTDSVVWIQIGGQTIYSAGNGIDAVALGTSTIATDVTARLKYTIGAIDLNTVTVPYGGTGAITLSSGNVLVGQGTSPVDDSKSAPSGDFVGTSDTQTLSSKTATASTNNITARALFSTNGSNTVSTFASAAPIAGQVLTATSGSLATWQQPETFEPARSIFVSQTASDISPNWTTLGARLMNIH